MPKTPQVEAIAGMTPLGVKPEDKIETHDLGHGWFANFTTKYGNGESLTLRNPDRGQRIDLSPESLTTLRTIFAKQA